FGRRRGDEPDVVEERSAERRLEEIVAEDVLSREAAERQRGAVVIAHDQAAGVAPRDELVHLPAVDLKNVLVVAVHRVAGELVRRDVASKIERRHRKVGGDSWVGRSGGLAVVDGRGKRRIELAVLVDLADGGERPGDAVGAGERPEQTVEGPVLLVD